MEYGTIEREIHVDATPEVVFEVISSPVHMREWWPATTRTLEPAAGARGELVFGDRASPTRTSSRSPSSTPIRRGASRSAGSTRERDVPGPQLVAGDLRARPVAARAPRCALTEIGFREMGWEVAVLEARYNDHVNGWDTFMPRTSASTSPSWSPPS